MKMVRDRMLVSIIH